MNTNEKNMSFILGVAVGMALSVALIALTIPAGA